MITIKHNKDGWEEIFLKRVCDALSEQDAKVGLNKLLSLAENPNRLMLSSDILRCLYIAIFNICIVLNDPEKALNYLLRAKSECDHVTIRLALSMIYLHIHKPLLAQKELEIAEELAMSLTDKDLINGLKDELRKMLNNL